MTIITVPRALLEQALEKLLDYWPKSDPCINGIRTALAAPDDVAEEMSAVADQYAHKLALDLECVLADYSGTWYDTAICTLGAYRGAMNAIHERESPTFMGEPLLPDNAHRGMTTAPTLHDAPETLALKAERDELLKLINRRKIHPHDIPLEIFLADLSTRTANVLRAEFDSLDHTDGFDLPFTVRHVLMFSRKEIKKWPGIGKKGLNEIEENLRVRGLQLWDEHDDRSLRLLREHKSYFAAERDARHEQELLAYEITVGNLQAERDALLKDAERYRYLRDMTPWTAISAFDKTRVAFRLASKLSEEAQDSGVDLDKAIDAAIAKAEGGRNDQSRAN